MTECFIYAFEHRGQIIYVGQSVNPDNRQYKHRRLRRDLPSVATFRILRKCPLQDANRIERQVVMALRRKGQCGMNRTSPPSTPRVIESKDTGFQVRIVETGQTFPSKQAAVRFLRVCSTKIKSGPFHNYSRNIHVTLEVT